MSDSTSPRRILPPSAIPFSDEEKERALQELSWHAAPPALHGPIQRPPVSPLTRASSRVSVDYFDPEGVRSLSQSLSIDTGARSESLPTPSLRRPSERTVRNEGDEPFSLERFLQYYIKRYGTAFRYSTIFFKF